MERHFRSQLMTRMTMTSRTMACGVITLLAAACRVAEGPQTIASPVEAPIYGSTGVTMGVPEYPYNAERVRLMDSVVTLLGPERGAFFLKNVGSTNDYRVGGDPQAQVLVNRILVIQDSLFRNAHAARLALKSNTRMVQAALAIPETWTYGDASAVLVFDGRPGHPDTILIPEGASAGNLAQAVRAYARLDSTQAAAVRGHVEVRGSDIPASWKARGDDKRFDREILTLQRAALMHTDNGNVRSMPVMIMVGQP